MHRERQRRGWIRWVGYLVVAVFLLPLIFGTAQLLAGVLD